MPLYPRVLVSKVGNLRVRTSEDVPCGQLLLLSFPRKGLLLKVCELGQ